MKKPVSVLLLLALMLCLSAGAFAQAPEPAPLPPLVTVRPAPDVDVAAVFVQKNKQPFTRESGRIVNLDSIWIYFTDGTFDQFVCRSCSARGITVLRTAAVSSSRRTRRTSAIS